MSPDRRRWIACRPGFLLPVDVLSSRFRHLFLNRIAAAFQGGSPAPSSMGWPRSPIRATFTQRVAEMRRIDWVVYAKPPFGGPNQVLAYLGRYTHRVAIANSRLIKLDDGRVSFQWRDYRRRCPQQGHDARGRGVDRRFLLHALPDGFQRIRHYGFLANGCRTDRLALCRRLVDVPAPQPHAKARDFRERYRQLTGRDLDICSSCGGTMVRLGALPPSSPHHATAFRCDTS